MMYEKITSLIKDHNLTLSRASSIHFSKLFSLTSILQLFFHLLYSLPSLFKKFFSPKLCMHFMYRPVSFPDIMIIIVSCVNDRTLLYIIPQFTVLHFSLSSHCRKYVWGQHKWMWALSMSKHCYLHWWTQQLYMCVRTWIWRYFLLPYCCKVLVSSVISWETDYAYNCNAFCMNYCRTCKRSNHLQTQKLLFSEFEYLIIKYISSHNFLF